MRTICFPRQALLHRCRLFLYAGILALIPIAAGAPAVPAFAGAEGYGAMTRGAGGGTVMAVTNLNDSGPGGFREIVEHIRPRIVLGASSLL